MERPRLVQMERDDSRLGLIVLILTPPIILLYLILLSWLFKLLVSLWTQ